MRYHMLQSTAMTAIVTALQKGVPAEDLKDMVEAAAAALQAAAEQDRVKATPNTLLLSAPPALKAEASTPAAAPLDAVMAQEVCCRPCTWIGHPTEVSLTMQCCISSSGSIFLA